MDKKSKVSLFIISGITFAICATAATAVVISNASRPTKSGAYQQISNIQQVNRGITPNAPTGAILPPVINPADINSTPNAVNSADATSSACNNIYPNGKFIFGAPDSGIHRSTFETCTAIVEMRAISGNSDIVLATALVGNGDTIDCNISSFPKESYTADAGEVIFPADREPTMGDVTKIMNKEQKQNAVLKIAAGTLIGAIAGNVTGKDDNGKLLGTNAAKMQNSAIGAITGAGLMTASSYTGKVVGDTILAAGVNAGAGAVVGNMVAMGNRVLLFQNCEYNKQKTTCLYGVVRKYKPLESGAMFYNLDSGKTAICTTDGNSSCSPEEIIGYYIDVNGVNKTPTEVASNNFFSVRNDTSVEKFCLEKDSSDKKSMKAQSNASCFEEGTWVRVTGGGKPLLPIAAVIPGLTDRLFGTSADDYLKWRRKNMNSEVPIHERLNDGTIGKQLNENNENYLLSDFYPTYQSAEDGGIIDLNNKARLKATATGAGAGAALGGFSGYMGATNEIELRWVSSVQAYKDSLQKIYCGTGTRFLGSYNDIIMIPSLKK